MTHGKLCVARLVIIALVALAGGRAFGQTGCYKGTMLAPFGINGTLKLCPEFSAKAPELGKQLDEIQKTLNGNKALMEELTHSAHGVNALGRDVDANRQLELLRTWEKELQSWVAGGQQQTLQQLSELSKKMSDLQDMIAQSKEDEKTAQQTTTALNGRLGDAIAALDVANAQKQLESIQAQLNQIHEDTQDIRQKVDEQAAREKAAADEEKRKAEEMDKDPNMYTRAQVMPSMSPITHQYRLMVYFYSRPPLFPPFVDSTFSIAFHKSTGEAWRVDATDKNVSPQGELWKLSLDEVGDRAKFCFVAHDRTSGRLKEWTQGFKIEPAGALGVSFVQEGDAAMFLTDGEPCDGVKEARQAQPYAQVAAARTQTMTAPSAQTYADQLAQQQALIYQRMSAMRAQSQTMTRRPEQFARITAEGSRRDNMNGNQWQIQVKTSPFRPGTTLYDVHVQANLVDASGRVTPLELSNRQLFVNIETRTAFVNHVAPKAVVCLTAKDPGRDRPYRLTQWFSIETNRVYWRDGGGQVPGDQATFVPSQPATLTEASDAACQ